jgi:uncharacterized phage protein (TIGR01671 family)
MREIKFKFWDTINKKMIIYQSWLIFNYHTGRIFDRHTGDYRDDIIKCQYTGLKDKNGKEIYEGDIIEEGIIIYHNEYLGFFVDIFERGYERYIPLYDIPLPEILGNIYENPELLESK